MATCRETVEGALRKLGKLGAGRSARPVDLEDGFEALKGLYRSWIDQGTFGRLRDVVPVTDYIAGENERILRNSDAVGYVTLPETIEGGFGPVTPLDLSVVVIVDAVDGQDQTWIYDAAFKRWVSIDSLALDSEAPLSRRDPNGLASKLAATIADEYGQDVMPGTARAAAAFQTSLTHRYSNPVVERPQAFM